MSMSVFSKWTSLAPIYTTFYERRLSFIMPIIALLYAVWLSQIHDLNSYLDDIQINCTTGTCLIQVWHLIALDLSLTKSVRLKTSEKTRLFYSLRFDPVLYTKVLFANSKHAFTENVTSTFKSFLKAFHTLSFVKWESWC